MKRTAIDPYDGPTTLGIDVSAYQPQIDWPQVARSEAVFQGRHIGPVKFAIVRGADGVQTRRNSKPDPMAVRHLQGAHEAGIEHLGLYFFLRAYHGIREQLAIVFDVVRVAGVPVRVIAIDVEGRPDDPNTPDTDESHGAWWVPDGAEGPVSTADVLSDVLEGVEIIRARGFIPLVYSGVAWHWYVAQQGRAPSLAEVGDLWTPYYTRGSVAAMPVDSRGNGAPWPSWRIHQFAGSAALPGRIAGIPGPIDLNRFRGDEAELRRWWGTEREATFDRSEILDLAERAKPTDPAAADALVATHAKLAG